MFQEWQENGVAADWPILGVGHCFGVMWMYYKDWIR